MISDPGPGAGYRPILERTRGGITESVHFGALVVADPQGRLIAQAGDPFIVTFLRSTAKPLQALALIEAGAVERFQLTMEEIALICASHAGTDAHVAIAQAIQSKAGVSEADLLCGMHPPYDPATAQALKERGEQPTPNRHNCSGKHSGMLALARLQGWPIENYIHPDHPVQRSILQVFAEMCALQPDQVRIGTDGCSAPNFAVPLASAAVAYARLCDPDNLPGRQALACRLVTQAMTAHPGMVGGPGRFDTRLMEVAQGRLIAKGGAEGYYGVGLLPGAQGARSSGLGIVLKVSDGDPGNSVRQAVILETLRQLSVLSDAQLAELAEFGPGRPILNQRGTHVGEARPLLNLSVS